MHVSLLSVHCVCYHMKQSLVKKLMISSNRANENRSFPRRESSSTDDTRLVHLWQRDCDDDSEMEFPPNGSAQGCPTESV